MKTKELFLKTTHTPEFIVNEYLSRGARTELDLWCKCGKPKRRKISKFGNENSYDSLDSYCGNKKCHPRFGIKRPEHSKVMAELAKSGANEKFNADELAEY